MIDYTLKLYVMGQTPTAQQALANLEKICKEELADRYEIVVIDILKQPVLAEQDKIIATPTLIKMLPEPMKTIIGDLSDTERVLLGLDIISKKKGNKQ